MYHRAKDRGCDHHLDQRNKAVSERLHCLAGIRIKITERHANSDRQQDLDIQDAIPRLSNHQGSSFQEALFENDLALKVWLVRAPGNAG